jgi:hypothetical protein
MAAVALSRSLNANLLRRWVVEAERAAEAPQGNRNPQPKALLPPAIEGRRFIPVAIEKPTHADPWIRVEIRRMKTLVHDGFGLWLCARRLYQGRFIGARLARSGHLPLTPEQLQAFIVGLPWKRLEEYGSIRVL